MKKNAFLVIAYFCFTVMYAQNYTQTSYDLCGTSTCGIYNANSTIGNPQLRLVCKLEGTKAEFKIEKCNSTLFTSNGTLKVIVSGSGDGPCEGLTIKTVSVNSSEKVSGKTFTSYTLNHPTNSLWYYGVFENTNGNKYYAGCIKITPVATPPTVITGSASPSPNSAFLTGTVNPNGFGTSYWFEYGTSTNLGPTSSETSITAGVTDKDVSKTITDLNPLTKYYYRLAARNFGGTTYGSTRSFTTTDNWMAPEVTTGNATNVTTNSVTLNGVINPNGFATAYTFKYGLTTSMNNTEPAINIGNGTSLQNVSMNVSGLLENSTYYYAIFAASTNGSNQIQYVQGSTSQFTTQKSNQAPTIPTNPKPANGTTAVSISPVLSWETSDPEGSAVGYKLYMGTSSTSLTQKAGSTSGTSVAITGLSSATTYYWKVEVNDEQSNTTQGPVWSFTTANMGSCDLTSIDPSSAYYIPTSNLCAKGILSGSSADGSVNVTDLLKRSHLAKIAFYGLYKTNGRSLPTVLPSDYYPTVYHDLNIQTTTNSYYFQAAKALLYLEYGDGISPFDRNKTNFNPDNFVARVDVLKVLMETFNIKPDIINTNNPYPTDNESISLMTNNPLKFGYIRKAASLGFITLPSGTGNTNFRPFADCLRGEAFVMLDRIIQWVEANTSRNPNPTESSYYTPLNVTLENLAMGLSLQQGNFNHYTKSSFTIDGIVPLGFAHNYNSYSTDLPDDFYCVNDLGSGKTETYKPLGTGWSHSYHSYATQVDDKLIIHWGGGQIDVYKVSGSSWVPMSVGLYDKASFASSILTIKTKSQIRYLFKRQNTSGPAILQL